MSSYNSSTSCWSDESASDDHRSASSRETLRPVANGRPSTPTPYHHGDESEDFGPVGNPPSPGTPQGEQLPATRSSSEKFEFVALEHPSPPQPGNKRSETNIPAWPSRSNSFTESVMQIQREPQTPTKPLYSTDTSSCIPSDDESITTLDQMSTSEKMQALRLPDFVETWDEPDSSDTLTTASSDGTSTSRMWSPCKFPVRSPEETVPEDVEPLEIHSASSERNSEGSTERYSSYRSTSPVENSPKRFSSNKSKLTPLEFVQLLLPEPEDVIKKKAGKSSRLSLSNDPLHAKGFTSATDRPEDRLSRFHITSPAEKRHVMTERGYRRFKDRMPDEQQTESRKPVHKTPHQKKQTEEHVQKKKMDPDEPKTMPNHKLYCAKKLLQRLTSSKSNTSKSSCHASSKHKTTTPRENEYMHSSSSFRIMKRTIVVAQLNSIENSSQNYRLNRCESQTSIGQQSDMSKQCSPLQSYLSEKTGYKKAKQKTVKCPSSVLKNGQENQLSNWSEDDVVSDGSTVYSTHLKIPVTSSKLHCEEIRKKREQIAHSARVGKSVSGTMFSKSRMPKSHEGSVSETSFDAKNFDCTPQSFQVKRPEVPTTDTQNCGCDNQLSARFSCTKSTTTRSSTNRSVQTALNKPNSSRSLSSSITNHNTETFMNPELCDVHTQVEAKVPIDAQGSFTDSNVDDSSTVFSCDHENPMSYKSLSYCKKSKTSDSYSDLSCPSGIRTKAQTNKKVSTVNFNCLSKNKNNCFCSRTVASDSSGSSIPKGSVELFNFYKELLKVPDSNNVETMSAETISVQSNTGGRQQESLLEPQINNPWVPQEREPNVQIEVPEKNDTYVNLEMVEPFTEKSDKNVVPLLSNFQGGETANKLNKLENKVKEEAKETFKLGQKPPIKNGVPKTITRASTKKVKCIKNELESGEPLKPLRQKSEPGTNSKVNRFGWGIPVQPLSRHIETSSLPKEQKSIKLMTLVQLKKSRKSEEVVKGHHGYLKATISSNGRQKITSDEKQQRCYSTGTPSRYLLTSSQLNRNSSIRNPFGLGAGTKCSLNLKSTKPAKHFKKTLLGKAQSLKELPRVQNTHTNTDTQTNIETRTHEQKTDGNYSLIKPSFSAQQLEVSSSRDAKLQKDSLNGPTNSDESSALKRAMHSLRRLVPFWAKEPMDKEVTKVNMASSNTHLLCMCPSSVVNDGELARLFVIKGTPKVAFKDEPVSSTLTS